MTKLTKRFIESIVPDPHKPLKYWDDEVRRFGVIILPSGRRTYCIEYRNANHVQKRVKIGVHGQITLEEARNIAKIRLGQVARGEDLAETIRQSRNVPTVSELAEKYLEVHAEKKKRPKSIKEDKSMLKNYILKNFGTRKVESISIEEIQDFHASLHRTPVRSNRILSLLHKMFKFAVRWGWRTDNPASGIEKYQEHKRTQWLQDDEMKRLLDALDTSPYKTTAYIIKLCLLTGARKDEVLKATWDQFDLEKGIWTKKRPYHQTEKNGTFTLIANCFEHLERNRKKENQFSIFIPRKG